MSNWKDCVLADLGEIVGGATPSTKNESYYGGDIAWITPKDLSTFQGRFIRRGERNITSDGFNSCSARLMPPHSILFTSRAPIGYVAIAENKVCTNQGFKSIVPNADTDYLFLYYLLVHNRDRIENMGSGTTFKEVSGSVMKGITVSVPTDIEEQKAIARVLGSLDDKIENNTAINNHLEQMAQAIFKSWFIDFEPFGGEMPSDWKSVVLGELCETVTKGTTPTTLKKQFVSQGINFVKAESILDDHSLDFGKLAFIDDETNTLLSRSVIRENDIIFTIAGTLGRFAYVGADLLPANTNQAVAIIRANTSKINPVTLYSFFVGGLHSDFYTKNIQQAVQANLSLTTIKSLPLSLPPKETLSEYSALVEPIFEQTFQNYAESRRLADLRDTLLPKLMSGELSVADLGDAK